MINRMELFINVNDEVYSPNGFLNDPEYRVLFSELTEEEKARVLEGFVRYLAITMRKLLKSSIQDQYYKRYWDPLSPGYEKFKRDHGLSDNIWEATGRLVNSISYRKSGNRFIVGIREGSRYPNNGPSVLFIAKCMEFGTKNMPARPLFGPVVRYMRRHIRDYWRLYLAAPRKYLSARLSARIMNFNLK